MKRTFVLSPVCVFFTLLFIFGCAHNQGTKSSSSVPLATYMKSVSESRQISKKTALNLPASVAILFVPGNSIPYTTLHQASENLKKKLLENPKYISSVNIVQADEAIHKISLDGIRATYAADIVIILSYQQDQINSQSGLAGLMDVTIIGAFIIPGVETKTITLVDAKVIHIPNQALIFRTSALDERSKYSTSYGLQSSVTEESVNGVLAATEGVGDSLSKTLIKFENYDMSQAAPVSFLASSETAQGNDYWKKVDGYKSSSVGGGAFGFVAMLLAIAVCFFARRRT